MNSFFILSSMILSKKKMFGWKINLGVFTKMKYTAVNAGMIY